MASAYSIASLVGKYEYENGQNVDEYLRNLGVGLVLRKVRNISRPLLEITFDEDAGEWTISEDSIFRNRKVTFKLGDAFSDETFDSRKCMSKVSIENNGIMKIVQTCDDGPEVTTMKEVTDEGLEVTLTCNNVSTIHVYRRKAVHGLGALCA